MSASWSQVTSFKMLVFLWRACLTISSIPQQRRDGRGTCIEDVAKWTWVVWLVEVAAGLRTPFLAYELYTSLWFCSHGNFM